MVKDNTIEIQKELFKQGGKLGKYQELILGEKGFFKLIKYEWVMLCASWVPGALGLFLRSKLYPMLLGRVGRNVTFGSGVVIRHSKKIFIGDNVVIDDQCVLDAKGTDNCGIFLGNGIFLGRNTILNCKNGDIILKDNVNISSNCTIFSASEVKIEADVLLAAYCYLVGGTHHFDDPEIPVLYQERSSKGILVGSGGWLGAHVSVFDGVEIGKNVVIGAGSVVNKNIPDYAIAAGVPAWVIKKRKVKVDKKQNLKSVTIAVINYNGESYLEENFDSIYRLNYPAIDEVFLVDNCSTDGSVELIRKKFPKVRIIQMENNLGPNTARNVAIRESKSELIFLLDKDVVLAPDVLSLLVETFVVYPQTGIASAQICYFDEPENVQYNGANIHFAGAAIQNKIYFKEPIVVQAVTAIGMLVDCAKAVEIGLFDEDYFFGWEDGDFAFRMTIAGYPNYVLPHAKVFHKKAKRGLGWVDYQVRNRWWFIFKTYNFRTLVVCFPAILLYQLAIMFYLILKGRLWDFLKGMFKLAGSLPLVLKKRKHVMRHKTVKDKTTLTGGHIDLIGDVGAKGIFKIADRLINLLLSGYWILAKWFVK